MNDQAIDRALREALDVSPSPDFVARVRMRVAYEPVPRSLWSRWTVWTPVAAGALVAAAIVVAIVVGSLDRVRHEPDGTTSANAPAATDVPLPVPRVREATPDATDVAPLRLAPLPVASGRSPTAASHVASGFSRTARGPDVLVPPGELAAMRRLLTSVRDRRIDLMPVLGQAPDAGADLRPSPDIAIPPITVEPLVPQTNGEGVRQ